MLSNAWMNVMVHNSANKKFYFPIPRIESFLSGVNSAAKCESHYIICFTMFRKIFMVLRNQEKTCLQTLVNCQSKNILLNGCISNMEQILLLKNLPHLFTCTSTCCKPIILFSMINICWFRKVLSASKISGYCGKVLYLSKETPFYQRFTYLIQ